MKPEFWKIKDFRAKGVKEKEIKQIFLGKIVMSIKTRNK